MPAALVIAYLLGSSMPNGAAPQVGDRAELRREVTSRNAADDGSSSETSDVDTLTIKTVAVADDGTELIYDLPPSATDDDRRRTWQFPAHVARGADGSLRLLNERDLQQRLTSWLALAKLSRAACGHWTFSWTAIRIECDPQSVLSTIRAFDLAIGPLRHGASYSDPDSAGAAAIAGSVTAGGGTFSWQAPVDPGLVRQEQAKADVAAADITGRSLGMTEALRAHAGEEVDGTIQIRWLTDGAGIAHSRTKITTLRIRTPAKTKQRTIRETLTRAMLTRVTP